MAQNITLKDKVTGDALYPQTTIDNIYDFPAWAKSPTFPFMTVTAISANTSSSCTITGASNSGKSQTIVYTNSTQSDLVVTVPTTYSTPDGNAIELTCVAGGYCEVNYININGTIFARGL